jgi:hypothetical protein
MEYMYREGWFLEFLIPSPIWALLLLHSLKTPAIGSTQPESVREAAADMRKLPPNGFFTTKLALRNFSPSIHVGVHPGRGLSVTKIAELLPSLFR